MSGRTGTDTSQVSSRVFTAFGGARCEIIACDATEADVSAVVADADAFERRLTRFDAASELSRFNAAAGVRASVSPLLGELLRACLDAYALSDGLVNAACLPALIDAGYDRSITEIWRHPSTIVHRARREIPALPQVLEAGPGWARLAAGCAIDLGGVGKGWLADCLCERFDNAAINLGGDVRTRGPGPQSAGWAVALCDGRFVTVRDAGIATSGIYAPALAGWASPHRPAHRSAGAYGHHHHLRHRRDCAARRDSRQGCLPDRQPRGALVARTTRRRIPRRGDVNHGMRGLR